MQNLAQVVSAIKTRRGEVERELHGLDAALKALQGLGNGRRQRVGGLRRRLSAAARKRISDAQKARWAKFKKKKT
jgi:hypothetical protein